MRLARRLASIVADGDFGTVERPAPGKAPTAFRIWKAGLNETDKGDVVFSQRSAELLMAEQSQRGTLYSFDYDHLSLTPDAPLQNRVAAGWHRLEVRNGNGGPELWAIDCEWTSKARAGLEQSPPEWRYFSPAFDVDKSTREVVSYCNCAITNTPATWGIESLAASRLGDRERESLLAPLDPSLRSAFADAPMDIVRIAASTYRPGLDPEVARSIDARMGLAPRLPPFRMEGCRHIMSACTREDRARLLRERASRPVRASRSTHGLPKDVADTMDARMGINASRKPAIRNEGHVQVLSAITAEERAEIMSRRARGVK